jgi:molybdopterin-guanine dinucleotide biosynthesis protein A
MVQLLVPICDPVVVIGRGNVPDVIPGLGPIGGIFTALTCSSTSLNLIVAVDLPLLTSRFLNDFKEWCDSSPRELIACKIASGYPLCLGVRAGLKSHIEQYIRTGKRSLHGLLESVDCELIDGSQLHRAGHEDILFLNINTEADYQAALASDKP